MATPVNGGPSPTYEWQKNGIVYNGITGSTLPVYNQTIADGDVFTCTMTSNAPCASPLTATYVYKFNYIKRIFPTTLSANPSGQTLAGADVKFTAHSQTIPVTQVLYYCEFYVNGIQVSHIYNQVYQGYGPDFSVTLNSLKDKDKVYCTTTIHTIGNPCGDVDTSNTITMSISSVLPLVLAYFDIGSKANELLLNWKTITETNTSYFNIQASTDGISFINVGKVNAFGNSSNSQYYNYTYQPTSVSAKTYYFRLQMVDEDGSSTLSAIKSSSIFNNFQVSVFPNPANNIINISGATIKKIQLYNLSGKLLMEKMSSSNNISISTTQFSRGVYLLRVTNLNDDVQTQKVLLQ